MSISAPTNLSFLPRNGLDAVKGLALAGNFDVVHEGGKLVLVPRDEEAHITVDAFERQSSGMDILDYPVSDTESAFIPLDNEEVSFTNSAADKALQSVVHDVMGDSESDIANEDENTNITVAAMRAVFGSRWTEIMTMLNHVEQFSPSSVATVIERAGRDRAKLTHLARIVEGELYELRLTLEVTHLRRVIGIFFKDVGLVAHDDDTLLRLAVENAALAIFARPYSSYDRLRPHVLEIFSATIKNLGEPRIVPSIV